MHSNQGRRRVAWGATVAAALASSALAACSAAPPPPPPAPLPPAPPPAPPEAASAPAPAPAPPPPAPGLGPFVALTDKPLEGRELDLGDAHIVPTGEGAFLYVSYPAQPSCYLTSLKPGVCEGWAFARRASGGELEAFGAFSPFEQVVRRVSSGPAGAYVTTDQKIEQMRADGSRTLVAELPSRTDGADVIETPEGRVVVAAARDTGFSIGRVKGDKVESLKELNIRYHPDPSTTARTARYDKTRQAKTGYGAWKAFGWPTRSGGVEVMLAWTEAIAPPKRTSQDTPVKSRYPQPTIVERPRLEKMPRFFGCSAPSRRLSSPSVEKRFHLSRLSPEGKIARDEVVPFPSDFDPLNDDIHVAASVDSLQVNGEVFDRSLRPTKATPPPLAPRAPRLVHPAPAQPRHLQFDPRAGEGLAIFSGNTAQKGWHAYRFGPQGKPVGEPVVIARSSLSSLPDVPAAHVGGGWLVPNDHGSSLQFVSGPRQGQSIAVASAPPADGCTSCSPQVNGLLTIDDDTVLLVVSQDTTYTARVNVTTGDVGPWQMAPQRRERVGDDFVSVTAGDDGVLVRSFLGLEARRPKSQRQRLLPVWKDMVLFEMNDGGSVEATWLRSGKKRPLTDMPSVDRNLAPFVMMRGPHVVGAEGEIFTVGPEVQEAGCSLPVPVGPRAVAMACVEGADGEKLTIVPGLRVYGLEPEREVK